MPNRLKTRCGYHGCPRTTRNRFCDEHAPLARRVQDRKRGSAVQRGYDSSWRHVADGRRLLDRYLCQHCLRDNRWTSSRIVDHIVPIHVRPDWRLEVGNTQVLCFDCHVRKTIEDVRIFGGPMRKNLTDEQLFNRREAKRLEQPPREAETSD